YVHRLTVPAETGDVITDPTGFAGAVAQAMRSASVDAELKARKIVISAILQKRQDERAKQMFGMSSGTID
ncbi:hypothetical protein OU790_20065, partial [Ruegeria sp. NA]